MQRASRAALARSRSIDQQLDEDRERRQREIQLLILGGASSGKSTFIKQLQIHLGDGFSEEERMKFIPLVIDNLLDAVHLVMKYMEDNDIPRSAQTKQLYEDLASRFPKKKHLTYVARPASALADAAAAPDSATRSPSSNRQDQQANSRVAGLLPNNDVLTSIPQLRALWQDPAIRGCLCEDKTCRENLEKSDIHFLEEFDRLTQPNCTPSIQDILYIRKPTLGVQEHLFNVDGLAYRVIDVAGQKNQRKKWIHFFDGVTAVMYFVALSGFCQTLEEDTSLNSLQDSFQTFREVSHNKYLDKTDFLLFLNKKDVFEEKISTHKFSDYFHDYQGENTLNACCKYIREEFNRRTPAHKRVYPHVSCAVDVNTMRNVITEVMQIVVEINLRRAASF